MWLMFSKKLERHIEITAGLFSLVILILFRPILINNPPKNVVSDIDKYKYCTLWLLEISIPLLTLEIFELLWTCIDHGERPSTHDKRNGASEPLLEKAGAWSLPRMGCFNHEFDIQNITIVWSSQFIHHLKSMPWRHKW